MATTPTPQVKASYNAGELLPAVGTPEYAAAQAAQTAVQQGTSPVSPYYSRLPTDPATPSTPTTSNTPKITQTPDVAAPDAFDETTERSNEISQRQGDFEALDQLYDGRIADATKREQDLGAKDLARANTISALTGGTGGVDATTRAGQVDKKTQDIIQQKTDDLNAEKAQLIAGIYDKIDTNVQREKDIAQQNERADRTKLVDQMNQSAQSNIMEFATNGVSWNDAYKDPDFQAEVQRTGKSPFEIQTLYNSSLPKSMQPEQLFSGFKGNNFVQINRNADGTVSTTTQDAKSLGLSADVDPVFQTINGQVYWYDKNNPVNSDGSPRLTALGSSGNGTDMVPSGAPTGVTADDIKAGAASLNTDGATGGYANPIKYRQMYDFWITQGGSRASFLKAYPPKLYINPAQNTLKATSTGEYILPDYLRTESTEARGG